MTIPYRVHYSDDVFQAKKEEKHRRGQQYKQADPQEKISNHGCWGKHAHILDNDYWGIYRFHVVWTNFCCCNYSYVVHTNFFYFYFINWTLRMSDNLPVRFQILGYTPILCITVREQLLCDLVLKSAFERILNVMQLNLVKIKRHIKWKYLVQKFHDIGLSYYFKYKYVTTPTYLSIDMW